MIYFDSKSKNSNFFFPMQVSNAGLYINIFFNLSLWTTN